MCEHPRANYADFDPLTGKKKERTRDCLSMRTWINKESAPDHDGCTMDAIFFEPRDAG